MPTRTEAEWEAESPCVMLRRTTAAPNEETCAVTVSSRKPVGDGSKKTRKALARTFSCVSGRILISAYMQSHQGGATCTSVIIRKCKESHS